MLYVSAVISHARHKLYRWAIRTSGRKLALFPPRVFPLSMYIFSLLYFPTSLSLFLLSFCEANIEAFLYLLLKLSSLPIGIPISLSLCILSSCTFPHSTLAFIRFIPYFHPPRLVASTFFLAPSFFLSFSKTSILHPEG